MMTMKKPPAPAQYQTKNTTTTTNTNNDNGMNQEPIIATASDAIISKLTTASMGYYTDPFLPYFVTNAAGLTCSSSSASTGGGGGDTNLNLNKNRSEFSSSSSSSSGVCRVDNSNSGNANERGSGSMIQQPKTTRSTKSSLPSIIDDGDDEDDEEEDIYVDNDKYNKYIDNSDTNNSNSFGMTEIVPTTPPTTSTLPSSRRESCQSSSPPPHHRRRPLSSRGRHHAPPSPMQLQQQPIIRRGTHARVSVMDRAIAAFLSLHSNHSTNNHDSNNNNDDQRVIQVVVLGSGRDTTYFRSQAGLLHVPNDNKDNNDNAQHNPHNHHDPQINPTHVRWYEVDHSSVIQTKHDLIEHCSILDVNCEQVIVPTSTSTGATDATNTDISFRITPNNSIMPPTDTTHHSTKLQSSSPTSNQNKNSQSSTSTLDDSITNTREKSTSNDDCIPPPYHLIGYDLRQSFPNLLSKLCQHHFFSLEAPTLFVLECVQMYLPESVSRHILTTITKSCHRPFLILYDPILLNDPFGNVMEQNLRKAGIYDPSLSIATTRTLQNQIDKLLQCGFHLATGCDMMAAYDTVLTAADRARANKCEMLDEIEEWVLIMRHYCFIVATAARTTTESTASTENCETITTNSTTTLSSSDKCEQLQDHSISWNDDDISEKFCSTDVENSLGFVAVRCLSQRSTTANDVV